jgi:hypothetical protein
MPYVLVLLATLQTTSFPSKEACLQYVTAGAVCVPSLAAPPSRWATETQPAAPGPELRGTIKP